MNNSLNSYKKLKILVTGSTGFKGSWLCFWLHLLGAKIIGVSLKPEKGSIIFKKLKIEKKIKQYYQDITNFNQLDKIVVKERPDLIFHLAAQSIVSQSYEDPLETINSNVVGSANVLETVRKNKIENLIYVTSDKCYLNDNRKKAYKENDILGGDDLYSSSKAVAEIIFSSFYRSFFYKDNKIKYASVRAGNVIGGGDMKKDRIIPDIIKSILKNKPLHIRSPKSIRPWQHVLEPIYGYLVLGSLLINKKISKKVTPNWNFGPNQSNVKTVLDVTKKVFFEWKIQKKIIIKKKTFKETNFLKLDSKKSYRELNWSPKLNFSETIKLTVDWYKALKSNKDLEKITEKQIAFFMKKKS
jgi:CDP-glucose 4,6-dehydratase